ncbi:MAG: shikimate dehydrogenase [Clostridium sp.]|nr:shikimate dehydrogenase [Clostridium sp.]
MEFFGLLGEKLSHSLSPDIHNELLRLINREGAYKLFEVEKNNLKEFIEAIKLLKIKGCNVTIPYKKAVMEYIDIISDEAKSIGAINTISLKDGKLYGYNTDYFGFGYMLKVSNIDVANKIVVILGNGGASRAVLQYLLNNDVLSVYIVSRNPNYHEYNNDKIKVINYKELESIDADILVNTTPVGMYPNIDSSPVNEEIINKYSALVDIIYNPIETKFLALGKQLNKKTVGGLYMLVGQAVKAEEIWQDIDIEESVIEKIYKKIEKKLI